MIPLKRVALTFSHWDPTSFPSLTMWDGGCGPRNDSSLWLRDIHLFAVQSMRNCLSGYNNERSRICLLEMLVDLWVENSYRKRQISEYLLWYRIFQKHAELELILVLLGFTCVTKGCSWVTKLHRGQKSTRIATLILVSGVIVDFLAQMDGLHSRVLQAQTHLKHTHSTFDLIYMKIG